MPAINERVVLGWAELDKNLQATVLNVRLRAMRRGLYAGATTIRDEARRLVRVRFGFLRRQIQARSGSSRVGQEQTSHVFIAKGRFTPYTAQLKRGATTKYRKTTASLASIKGRYINPRRYAHLIEFGTKNARAFSFLFAAVSMKRQAAQEAILAKVKQDMGW